MKLFYIAAICFAMLSICNCGLLEGSDSVITEVAPQEIPKQESDINPLLIGKWQVDSSGFINDGIQKPMSAPLADSFWEFTTDGKLNISGNISFSTDIKIVDNSFVINMMNIDSDYHIKSVTENELVLVSIIVDTKDMKMETISKFKKVK